MILDWTAQGACQGLSPAERDGIFFPTDPSSAKGHLATLRARKICVNCPVFDQCVAWMTEHYDDLPCGTVAGYDEKERNSIDAGLRRLVDWRPGFSLEKYSYSYTFNSASGRKRRLEPAEKEARRARRREGFPSCPYCHSNERINRNGRSRDKSPRYICWSCQGKGFTVRLVEQAS